MLFNELTGVDQTHKEIADVRAGDRRNKRGTESMVGAFHGFCVSHKWFPVGCSG
jgi:hypothetical protein